MRDAQQLYNTRFAAGCQQFLQRFLHLFQIFSFGLFLIKITLVFPLPWRPSAQKAAPQAPEVPACGAAFAVCGALDRCMELEAMYRKGWQDAEKLVQWYRAAKAEA